MKRSSIAFLRVLVLLAAFCFVVGPAAPAATAQVTSSGSSTGVPTEEPIRPPTAGKPDSPPVVLYWMTLGATILLVVGVNLMPSKRGHQD